MQIDVKEFAALFDDTPTDRSSSWKRRSGFVGKLQEYLKSSKIPWSCKNWHLGNIHRFWTNPAVDVGVQCEQCMHQKFTRAPAFRDWEANAKSKFTYGFRMLYRSKFSASPRVPVLWALFFPMPNDCITLIQQFSGFPIEWTVNPCKSSLVLHRLSTKL
jgi:hypothetical protein